MISKNLAMINNEIDEACTLAHRDSSEVTVIGVTKSVDGDMARALVENGISNLAENRVDKLLEKKEALADLSEVKWHLIGNLQRRKVKDIINEIDYFHALDSLRLAQEINKRANKVILCFIEVNVSGEASKHGIAPEDLSKFVEDIAAFDKIKVVGLMTMAPYNETNSTIHGIFNKLKELQIATHQKNLPNVPCTELSMGMSNDFPIAIEEGATYVRIGRLLFGEA